MRVRPDVEALIRAGLSNAAIARELRVSTRTVRETRTALGEPPSPHGYPGGLSLEEAWAARTRPVDGGHLAWTGHINGHGVPMLTWRGRKYSAYRVAFRMRAGREPVGQCGSECDHGGCVAPACVYDTAARQRDRAVLASGLLAGRCGRGHDRAVYGRRRPDGRPYCQACNRGGDA